MSSDRLLLVKYGEIHLKGQNRPYFRSVLRKRLKENVKRFHATVTEQDARVYITGYDADDEPQVIDAAARTFGVVGVCPALRVEKDMQQIFKAAKEELLLSMQHKGGTTFKVKARRQDKTFMPKSDGVCREVGAYLLQNIEGISVDVHKPEHLVEIEIRDAAYVYAAQYAAVGGMPVGTSGVGALMLSGGIDSPVSGYMMAKRGLSLLAVHFLSPPYTGEAAKQKVIELTKLICRYTGPIDLHLVHFTHVQEQIYERCDEEYLTVIMRRFMMRITEKIAQQSNAQGIITGESLGQVASQTIGALHATDSAVDMLVLRPLIGMDKYEIIDIAKRIGTFETSTLPGEDCCTVFVPKHPVLKPTTKRIDEQEAKLDIDALVEHAIANTTVEFIKTQ